MLQALLSQTLYNFGFLLILLAGLGNPLMAQDLTLTGASQMAIMSNGMSFSAPHIKLDGTSKLIGAEVVEFSTSGYFQLKSPLARVVTNDLFASQKVDLSIGSASKTGIIIQNTGAKAKYQLGMDNYQEQNSLPFQWIIESFSGNFEHDAILDFSWAKEVEPREFALKALLSKGQFSWELPLKQQIGETNITLSSLKEILGKAGIFTVKNFVRDLDEDEVPDIREIQTSTDLLDPSDYLDSDGDGVPDYVEDIQNTEKNNPNSFLDTNEDKVPDYLAYRSPFSFLDLRDVAITWGNMNFLPLFQDSVLTMLGSGRLMKLPVSWDGSKVNVFARGSYPASGKLSFPRGVFNAYGKNPETNGIVLPKPAPTDILLSNNRFDAPNGPFEISIGRISTVDPADNIHWPGLPYGLEDNIYFKVENDMLVWRGEDPAAGRDNFKVVIRVTDRDLNTLDKLFEIKRLRPTIAELEVFNTFSPDEDGLNDTWGVPSLRYFQGVRIQIFDRGGERVFYTENPDIKWDGVFNNQPAPIGTYYWTIEVRETGEVRRGMLNLFRK